ncbi:hypothetical protein BLOT_002620 [Blomia tropicalis]|nr:hypothetical protein BLOT_002620 [Blomia tropicalis]
MSFLLVNDLTFGLISIENEKSKKINDYAFMRMLCNVCCDEGGTANDDNEGLIHIVHELFVLNLPIRVEIRVVWLCLDS